MRALISGVFLGLWITILLALVEKYKMANYTLEILFAIITLTLLLLFLWPIILNKLQDTNPRWWLKINKMFIRRVADGDFWRRLEEQEARKKGKKEDGDKNGNK